MIDRIARLWHGLRTNGAAQTRRAVMRRLGVHLSEFYWMEEVIPENLEAWLTALPDGLVWGTVGPADLPQVAAFQAPSSEVDLDRLQEAFARKDLCLGIRQGEELVAFACCTLDHTHTWLYPIALGAQGAYLNHMYVVPSCRGKNLAGILRGRCYQELRALGRDRFFSISLATNAPAIRFKEKLGARKRFRAAALRVGSWHRTIVVRRYGG